MCQVPSVNGRKKVAPPSTKNRGTRLEVLYKQSAKCMLANIPSITSEGGIEFLPVVNEDGFHIACSSVRA